MRWRSSASPTAVAADGDVITKASQFNIQCLSRSRAEVLLFNALTTRLLKIPIVLENELSTALQTGQGDPRLLEKLREGGFLVSKDKDEIKLVAAKHELAQLPNNLFLSILTTLGCNMDCPYCFQKRRQEKMGQLEGEAILNYLSNLPQHVKHLTLDWFGGEPLMNYDFIRWLQPRIVELMQSTDIAAHYSMTTNGTLLSGQRLRTLAAMGLNGFQFTVDGPPVVHDSRRHLTSGRSSFSLILKHIRAASELCHVVIRVNVDKSNIHSLSELVDILHKERLFHNTHLTFQEIVPSMGTDYPDAYAPSEMAKVIQPLEEYAISKGFTIPHAPTDTAEYCPVDSPLEFMIGPGLSVFKCGESCIVEVESVGRLSEAGELTFNSKYDLWRNKGVMDDAQCRACSYLPQCMGGCSLKRLFHRRNWCPREKYNLEWFVQCLFEQRQLSRAE